ncbi:MAG: SDR family oxidoreductase [Cyclobacteriaceae bacterium]|jgi:UDP-glucose 4-epimerase
MKVLITGGAGYVGTELTKTLVKCDDVDDILIYDNLGRQNYNLFLGRRLERHEKVNFISGDILDSRKLRMMLEGVDVVIHLAARVTTPFANTDAHFHEQVNHWGTAEVVNAVEESGVQKFIYASSTSVYGSSKDFLTEDTIPNAKTFYGISKLRGEEHVRRLFKKKQTYVLRCGNVYGYSKSMRFDAVINKFMFEANFNNRISIHGNGKQSRSFISVGLLAEVMEKLIINEVPGGNYNLVDKNYSILDIVDALKTLYPLLEFIFVNQHLSLRDLKVSPESKLRNYLNYINDKDLKTELLEFKRRFSF